MTKGFDRLLWCKQEGERMARLIIKHGGVYRDKDDTIKFPNRAAAIAFAWEWHTDAPQ